MSTSPVAARASDCAVPVIGGGPAGSTAAALPAGDMFGKAPIHRPMLLFKGRYYAASLFNFRRTFKAWRTHKHNIRVVNALGAALN